MLHHQHPVPMSANQMRDSGRMTQVPMRITQQRPAHGAPPLMMGMQTPQPGVMVSMAAPVVTQTIPPQPSQVPPTSMSMGSEVTDLHHSQHHHPRHHHHPQMASMPQHHQSYITHHAHKQQQQQSTQGTTIMGNVPLPPNTGSATAVPNNGSGDASAAAPLPSKSSVVLNCVTNGPSVTGITQPILPDVDCTLDSNNTSNLANTKEKTPMCLINELARFNKIQHQYRLTNETGPAHKKRFTVTLKLGEEEYSADGPSIKKAQHAAAAEALTKTAYKHPPPKTQKNCRLGKSGNITPTVELNALAMKRGEPAVYSFIEPQMSPYVNHHPGFNCRGMYDMVRYPAACPPYDNHRRVNRQGNYYPQYDPQRYPYGKQPQPYAPMFSVSLRVGMREYYGEGPTPQVARHDAAGKALNELRLLPLPEENQVQESAGNSSGNSSSSDLDLNAELKSPISLVHEVALKYNLGVSFEVISEKGPPHMRTFVTRCTVGDKVTEGEGNGKKVSKKRAAEKMLEELRKMLPAPPTVITTNVNNSRLRRKPVRNKKKTRNLIKEQKVKPDYGEDISPISRLIQLQQAKKEKEPVYILLEERGVPRRREFIMQVSVGQHSCTGTGPNKKLAKRAAAEGLLKLLGYSSSPSPGPVKPALKSSTDHSGEPDKPRKVTFLEDSGDKNSIEREEIPVGGSAGRQLVPGLLLMSDAQGYSSQNSSVNALGSISMGGAGGNLANMKTTATIAKELLKGGTSPTAEALAKCNQPVNGQQQQQQQQNSVRPKEQLCYLAQVLNFSVQFRDFPKGNRSEYLSLVCLSTDPQTVCHGSGPTIEASHDQAALTALRVLSDHGLDSVTSSSGGTMKKGASGLAASDGIHRVGGQKQANSTTTTIGGK